jgi:hypothetical protein
MKMSRYGKTMSPMARRFVERKFAQFRREAGRGCGLFYELYAQNFTDYVDGLASKVKRSDLREYIQSEARKDDDYVPPESGRWEYMPVLDDVHFFKPGQDTLDLGAPPEKSDEEVKVETYKALMELMERATTVSREPKAQPPRAQDRGIER